MFFSTTLPQPATCSPQENPESAETKPQKSARIQKEKTAERRNASGKTFIYFFIDFDIAD
jgi:hypothetical protein